MYGFIVRQQFRRKHFTKLVYLNGWVVKAGNINFFLFLLFIILIELKMSRKDRDVRRFELQSISAFLVNSIVSIHINDDRENILR